MRLSGRQECGKEECKGIKLGNLSYINLSMIGNVKEERESVFRKIRATKILIVRPKTRMDGGWKCETEGEEKVMEVKKAGMENRPSNIWHFVSR